MQYLFHLFTLLIQELEVSYSSPIEVKYVLTLLATGKASWPNGLNNRVLKELAIEICVPLCNLLTYLSRKA